MIDQMIRFTRGVPATESFDPHQLSECATTVIPQYSALILQYGASRGFAPLRELLAKQDNVDPQRVILGQGSLQLQEIIARAMRKYGNLAFSENPSYDRALTILKRADYNLLGFPLESDGIDVDAVEERLRLGDHPVLFYIIPDFQNPSGAVLSLEKRIRISNLAKEYNFLIVEDSPYRRLRYRGETLPSLFELAPDHVFKMSSYSKLICPGIRVGYTIVPDSFAESIAKWAEDTYINCSYINQAIVFDYEQKGWLEDHIQFLKDLYLPRLDAMLKSLNQYMNMLGNWYRPEGGFFVGVTLNKKVNAQDLLQSAEKAMIQLSDGRNFFTDSNGDQFVRLPFCALTPEEIVEGVARLATVINSL